MPTATAPAIASSSSRLGKLSVRVGWSRVLQVDDLQRKLLNVDKRIYMVKKGRGFRFGRHDPSQQEVTWSSRWRSCSNVMASASSIQTSKLRCNADAGLASR